jgi:hypothetical protein
VCLHLVQVGAERYWEALAACGERMGDTTPKRGAAGGDDQAAARERGGAVASVGRRGGVNGGDCGWADDGAGAVLVCENPGQARYSVC